jgi:hypothetical protein
MIHHVEPTGISLEGRLVYLLGLVTRPKRSELMLILPDKGLISLFIFLTGTMGSV